MEQQQPSSSDSDTGKIAGAVAQGAFRAVCGLPLMYVVCVPALGAGLVVAGGVAVGRKMSRQTSEGAASRETSGKDLSAQTSGSESSHHRQTAFGSDRDVGASITQEFGETAVEETAAKPSLNEAALPSVDQSRRSLAEWIQTYGRERGLGQLTLISEARRTSIGSSGGRSYTGKADYVFEIVPPRLAKNYSSDGEDRWGLNLRGWGQLVRVSDNVVVAHFDATEKTKPKFESDTPNKRRRLSEEIDAMMQRLAKAFVDDWIAPALNVRPIPTLYVGDRWEYVYVDSRKEEPRTRTFTIVNLDRDAIAEQIDIGGVKKLSATHHKGEYLSMVGGMQFAPYYAAFQERLLDKSETTLSVDGGDACATREDRGGDYATASECEVKAQFAGRDRVTVPAGMFDAVRVHVTIDAQQISGFNLRQHIGDGDFWVSSETRRIVKAIVRYDAERPWTETMELVSYGAHGEHTAAGRMGGGSQSFQ